MKTPNLALLGALLLTTFVLVATPTIAAEVAAGEPAVTAPACPPSEAVDDSLQGFESGVVYMHHGGCHVSADCECGGISCQGQSCSGTSNSVTCDGQTTYCSQPGTCSASTSCPGGGFIGCQSPDCDGFGSQCIKEEGCWVACDVDDDGFQLQDFQWCPGFEGCLTCPCEGWP